MKKFYREVKLDGKAKIYMISQLKKGHALGKILAEKVKEEAGEIITIIPTFLEIDRKILNKFDEPGLFSEKTKRRNANVVPIENVVNNIMEEIVFDFLEIDPNAFAMVEDFFLKPSDGCFDAIKIPMLIKENEVFYWMQFGTKKEHIKKAMKEGHNFFPGLIGMLGISSKKLNWGDKSLRQKVSSKQLETLVADAQKIILGAYDGEGLLIWEKAH